MMKYLELILTKSLLEMKSNSLRMEKRLFSTSLELKGNNICPKRQIKSSVTQERISFVSEQPKEMKVQRLSLIHI